MNTPTNATRRFRRVDPTAEARHAESQERELHGIVYSLFTEGNQAFEFKDTRYYFRFLPQPEDAQNSWSLTIPYIYLDPNQTPGHRGYLALTIPQATLIDNVRRALYSHADFEPLMASETNRNGISLSLKYRSVFMGFCYNDPDPVVSPIALPSNGFTRPKGNSRLQAGTVINSFMLEKDSAGNPKYGDIVDLQTGRLISIEIMGASKDRREYLASVDRIFPLDESHNHLLDQIKRFEDIIAYHPNDTIYEIIKLRLRPEMWDYVVAKLQLRVTPKAIVRSTTTPAIATPAATPVAPAVAAPRMAIPARAAVTQQIQPAIASSRAPDPVDPVIEGARAIDVMSDVEIKEEMRRRGISIG